MVATVIAMIVYDDNVLHIAGCCSVLQCVAVCCSVHYICNGFQSHLCDIPIKMVATVIAMIV